MPVLPFIPFPNCAEVVCQGEFGGTASYLTFGVRKGSPMTTTDLEDIADLFGTWLSSNLLPELYDTMAFNSVKVTDLSDQFAPVFVGTNGLPASGSVTGASVTNQVAAIVSFKTAQRGRSFRGRNYVGGLPAAALLTTSSLTSTFISAIQDDYDELSLALGAAGYDHVVLSRYENLVRRTTGVATRVDSYIVRPVLGTQRRRLAGHGI